jgi:adenylate kinase
MNLIFIGPQGSGKGTQAKKVASKLGFCHISTGDLLRSAKGDLKLEIDALIDEGNMVSDELMIRILKERLDGEDCDNGFILDGFPRNVEQARDLRKIVDIDKVVEIVISDKESVKRISGRRGCKKCGAIYNVNTSPKSSVEGVCDKCGTKLFRRKDDNEEALLVRLGTYHKDTEPILKMYAFMKIDGEQSIGKVEKDILEGLGKLS